MSRAITQSRKVKRLLKENEKVPKEFKSKQKESEVFDGELSLKQLRFCQNFVRTGGRQSQSAIEAGFSPASARTTAYRLLKRAEILAKIAEIEREHTKSAGITFEWKINCLKKVIDQCASGKGLRDDLPLPQPVISAIAELNRMQGDIIERSENLHAVTSEPDEIGDLVQKFEKEY